jgi:hypothetical protein
VRKTPSDADNNGRSFVQDLKQLLELNDDRSPAATSPSKFKLPGIDLVFSVLTEPTMYSRPKVIELIPYIMVDARNESFCYSALLLHTSWPFEGEIGLLARENIHRMDVDMDAETAVRINAGTDVIMDEDTHVIMDDDPYICTDDESDTDVPDVIHGDDANDEGSDGHDEDDADDVRDVHAEEVAGADTMMEDSYASATHVGCTRFQPTVRYHAAVRKG